MELDLAGLEVLDRGTCLQLLAGAQRGRIAINLGALPTILPVRYVLDDDRVLISVTVGSALDRATDGAVVAVQVEGMDELGQQEWSVCAVGTAHHVDASEALTGAACAALAAWAPEAPTRLVAVTTDRLTGRRTVSDPAIGLPVGNRVECNRV
jgi:nitroimidazol reductase NimA-like FMN-containing flavoprotein (pyridoxamine 5'-phosphate oxidase superfamily)